MNVITGVRTVSIPVEDQDAALNFYVDTLGFRILRDNATPNGGRWIELAPGGDNVIVTLERARPGIRRGASASASPPTTWIKHTWRSPPPGWTPTRSCDGPASPQCSPSATRTAMPPPSPEPHKQFR